MVLFLFGGATLFAAGERTAQPTVTNAVLRYWMAFALMENPPVEKALPDLLDQVAAGNVPWSEEKFRVILDLNQNAIEIMQRASKLPECTWGLDLELGPSTPIAHLARGRALSRLNLLYGLRLI